MKTTIPKLKKKLDAIFSRYIRLFYSKDGYVACYTCGHKNEVKKMQNGHYIVRQYMATRYDENNCRPQCYACNMLYGGRAVTFRENLIKEIGEDKVLEMEQQRHQVFKKDHAWYEDKIKHYTEKVKELE